MSAKVRITELRCAARIYEHRYNHHKAGARLQEHVESRAGNEDVVGQAI